MIGPIFTVNSEPVWRNEHVKMMMMSRVLVGVFLISTIDWIKVQGFVFEGEERRRVSGTENHSGGSARTRRPTSGVTPGTIDSIFQIPIAVIQGTSAAAQSWSPENGDTINKVFDIPVQTLQAVGNLVKDRIPQRPGSQSLQNQRDQRQTTRIHEQQQRERFQIQQQQEDNSRRHHHSFYDSWASAFADLLVGGHGHGGLWGGHGSLWGGHGDHGNLHEEHGHKKKKKKKPHYNSHGHLGSHNGLFGGHGQGVHEILGGDDNIYHVTEDIDDVVPEGIFPWKPSRQPERIQNKIAPGFNDRSRTIF